MKYKVLDNGSAVLCERQPALVRDSLILKFVDAPNGASAVFEAGGATYYRRLDNKGYCEIPRAFLSGHIRVVLAVLGGDTMERIVCENLRAEELEDGGALVSPDDMSLPLVVSQLCCENEELRKLVGKLTARMEQLEKLIDKFVKGHALL